MYTNHQQQYQNKPLRRIPSKGLPPVPPRPTMLNNQVVIDNKGSPSIWRKKQAGIQTSPVSVPKNIKDPRDHEVLELRKKVRELEKMQTMYKARIAELETQVSNFSVFHLTHNPVVKKAHKTNSPSRKKDLPPVPGQSIFYKRSEQIQVNQILDDSMNQAGIQSETSSVASTDSSFSFSSLQKAPSNGINPTKEKSKLLALYDYNTAKDATGRLSFKEGDVLLLISKGNSKSKNGWWIAECNGVIGKIPSNFVEELQSDLFFKARIVQQFLAQQPGDLEIHRGEVVTVLKRQENGWFLGEKGGQTGFFPYDCAERLAPIA